MVTIITSKTGGIINVHGFAITYNGKRTDKFLKNCVPLLESIRKFETNSTEDPLGCKRISTIVALAKNNYAPESTSEVLDQIVGNGMSTENQKVISWCKLISNTKAHISESVSNSAKFLRDYAFQSAKLSSIALGICFFFSYGSLIAAAVIGATIIGMFATLIGVLKAIKNHKYYSFNKQLDEELSAVEEN
ncbi:MAG: hypothetical protein ABIH99_02710 [Candidatus Micrarchaeota archaeon]